MQRVLVFISVLCAATAVAQKRRSVPEATACNSDDAECREDCTMEFGASIQTRAKLGTCIQACDTKKHDCTERWTELNQAGLDTEGFNSGGGSSTSGSTSRSQPEPRTSYDDSDSTPPPARTRATEDDAAPPPPPDPAPASKKSDPIAAPPPADDAPPVKSTRTHYEAPQEAKSTPAPSETEDAKPAAATPEPVVTDENYNEGIKMPSDAQLKEPPPKPEKKSVSAAASSSSSKKNEPPPPPKDKKKKDISEWDEGDIDY